MSVPTASGTSGSSDLVALEALMNEFFAVQTSNVRKREIEGILSHFGAQVDAWYQCLGFLASTDNHFVSMFSLTTLETIIKRRWIGMAGHEKAQIRGQLNEYLLKRHDSVPSYVANKAVKLLVDIAATDWPHFYPDFFENVLDTIRRRETLSLGLTMLLITSEELASPRDNVSSARKEELKRLLSNHVPQILATMTMVLESLLSYFHDKTAPASTSSTTTTPPPSPSPSPSGTHDESSSDSDPMPIVPTQSLLHVATHKIALQNSPPEADVVEAAGLALQCITHLFTWVPLSTVITARLLASIFHFAALGLHYNPASASTVQYTDLGILAMGTINEIIYRHCVPTDFEDFLLRMFQNTFQLLQLLVQPANGSDGHPRLYTLDELYVDKFTEFLHSFVKSHLRRFESNAQFPILGFLSLLFKYTFEQPRQESYLACLDVWSVCVDYVNGLVASRSPDAEVTLAKYREALLSLIVDVLKQMQFRYNPTKLEEMDDEQINDDEETEWQHYLRASIECIMKVSEVLPDDVLTTIDSTWQETLSVYHQLGRFVNHGKLVLSSEDECLRLHYLLRDFSSLLQIVGRLSVLFIGETFHDRLASGNEFMKHLIQIVSFSSKQSLYALETPVENLKADLVEVHAQALAALKAWCHWLAQLHSLALKNPHYEPQCKDLTSSIMVGVSPVIKDSHARQRLVHSAAHFMGTLTGTVRPPSIWKLKEFTELYGSLNQLKLEPDDHRLMVKALTNVLMLPWPGIHDQRWEERQRHLAKFLRDLTETFRSIRMMPEFPGNKEMQRQATPVIIHTLKIVGDLADNVLNEVTQTKKLCHDCIRDYIDIALWLFPIYVHESVMCEELFAFFHIVLDVLKSQMGAESVEAVIGTFINLFNKDQLQQSILHEGSSGVRVIEKFLGILQFVVKESDVSFRKFIDSTLNLCLDHIYPLVADKPTSDIKGPLFTVMCNVMMYNWRHFFKSSVMRSLMGAPSPASDRVLHRVHFLAILQAFGQSFMQPDISIFKQNLAALESLNEKWKLYQKPVFTETLIVQFLTVLLQVLIHKSHDLLREEITIAIFNMASVDYEAFFSRFLLEFLAKIEDLDANQREKLKDTFKTDTDLPTFTSNIARFISDLRYYKLCNASLPAGSVSFSL